MGTVRPNITERSDITKRLNITVRPNITERSDIIKSLNITVRPNITERSDITERPSITERSDVIENPDITCQSIKNLFITLKRGSTIRKYPTRKAIRKSFITVNQNTIRRSSITVNHVIWHQSIKRESNLIRFL